MWSPVAFFLIVCFWNTVSLIIFRVSTKYITKADAATEGELWLKLSANWKVFCKIAILLFQNTKKVWCLGRWFGPSVIWPKVNCMMSIRKSVQPYLKHLLAWCWLMTLCTLEPVKIKQSSSKRKLTNKTKNGHFWHFKV